MGMICAGGGRLDLVECQNKYPQRVCYVDGEILEEDVQERIKLLIPSLNLDEDQLRKNFHLISRVSQPDHVEDFLSLEEVQHQKDLLNWIREMLVIESML